MGYNFKYSMKRFILVFLFTVFSYPLVSMASKSEEKHMEQKQVNEIDNEAFYRKMIEDYKKNLSTVPSELRKEIRDFRIAIAKLQKEKRDLYKKLSIQAQEYLRQEEQFRRRLPVDALKNVSSESRDKIKAQQSNK
jgi:hypothetical protein